MGSIYNRSHSQDFRAGRKDQLQTEPGHALLPRPTQQHQACGLPGCGTSAELTEWPFGSAVSGTTLNNVSLVVLQNPLPSLREGFHVC